MSTTTEVKERVAKLKETASKKHITSHEKAVRRKPGRKAKSKGEKFDRRVVVYFREDQFEIVNEYCDLLNISVNEFIRNSIMEKLNKQDGEDMIGRFIDGLDGEKLAECLKDFLRG